MKPADYIGTFGQCARAATKNTAVFASVVMAQAILESADHLGDPGSSALVTIGRNHFRIPADPAWTGEKIKRPANEVSFAERKRLDAEFRVYRDDRQSFVDHVKSLLMNKRFHRDGVFTAPSPHHQAAALQNAHYVTDPEYAVTLIRLMRRYNLYALDQIKSAAPSVSVRKPNLSIPSKPVIL